VIRRALVDPDRTVRQYAIYGIVSKEFHPLAKEDVLLFATRLDDADKEVRSTAYSSIARLGKAGIVAMPLFVKAIGRDKSVFSSVIEGVARMGLDQDTLREFLETALESDVPIARSRATWEFAKFYPLNEEQVRRLAKLLDDPSSGVRSAAAKVIMCSGPNRRVVLPEMCKALLGKKIPPMTVGRMEPDAALALAGLRICLREGEDAEMRAEAAEALGALGADAEPAVPDLVKALTDDDPKARASAAHGLGDIGKPAAAAIPGLELLLKDAEPIVVAAGCYALYRIKGKSDRLVTLATQVLKDRRVSVARRGAYALGAMGADAKKAIPALIEAVKDKNQFRCLPGMWALGQMGPTAKEAIPALRARICGTGRRYVCERVALVLIEGKLDEHLPSLLAAMNCDPQEPYPAPVAAVGALGPAAKTLIPALEKLLKLQRSLAFKLGVEETLKKIRHGAKPGSADGLIDMMRR